MRKGWREDFARSYKAKEQVKAADQTGRSKVKIKGAFDVITIKGQGSIDLGQHTVLQL